MAKNITLMSFLAGSYRRYNKTAVAAIVALSFPFLLSCSEKRVTANPNIIMIVVDTLRADHLSAYGYARITDPNIADFAKHAVLFQRAVAPAPWTTPSFTSILESKFAFNHNMNVASAKVPEGNILTTNLMDAGYHTVEIQTNVLLKFLDTDSYFNERYFYVTDPGDVFLDQSAADQAETWLSSSANRANKLFFFVGLISPHWDYKTDNGYLNEFVGDSLYIALGPNMIDITASHPDGFGCWTYSDLSLDLQTLVGLPQSGNGYYDDARLYSAGYDSEIKNSDYQVGRILQKLKDTGLYDDAIIIITADHGENMADHPHYFSHSDNLYQSLLHVPLIIKFPRQTEQKIVSEHIRTIDILPTVLDYTGIGYAGTDGKSLLPIIRGDSVNFDERPVISYRVDGSGFEAVSLIKDNYKLIRVSGTEQAALYNLQDDPRETTDISAQEPDRVSQLKDFLKTFFRLW